MEDNGNPFGFSEDELKVVNQTYVKWGIRLGVIGILAVAVIWGGINLAPLIALALANWLWVLLYIAAAVLGWKIISSKFLIRAISRFIDNLAYRAYVGVIELDPIATAENNLSEMEKAESELNDLVSELEGNKSLQEEELKGLEAERERANNLAVQAGRENDARMQKTYMEEAFGYKKAYEEAQPYYKLVADLLEYYQKAQAWVAASMRRHRSTLDSKKRLFRIADLGQQSVDKIKKVIGGAKFKEFSIAINALNTEIHNDIGAVKNFMRATKPILDRQDFENRAFSREASAEFAKYVQNAPFLDQADKDKLLGVGSNEGAIPAQLQAGVPAQDVEIAVPVAGGTKDKFDRF